MNEIKIWIFEWFEKNTSADKDMLMQKSGENYLSFGIIDSFSFLNLIGDIEEKYKFSFNEEEFSNEQIMTIDGLAKVIKEHM